MKKRWHGCTFLENLLLLYLGHNGSLSRLWGLCLHLGLFRPLPLQVRCLHHWVKLILSSPAMYALGSLRNRLCPPPPPLAAMFSFYRLSLDDIINPMAFSITSKLMTPNSVSPLPQPPCLPVPHFQVLV